MFRSPPTSMVNTRSASRRAQQTTCEDAPATTGRNAEVTLEADNTDTGNVMVRTEQKTIVTPASLHGSDSAHSKASSVIARRKRLELEAAEAKARIQMELIEKRLAADIAELDVEYSPSSERNSVKVEKWMESSEQEHRPGSCQDGPRMGARCPPATEVAGMEGALHVLAGALKDLAASTSTQPNANLLSRLSTPKDLPCFSGDPMEWLQFRQAYEESTEVCNFSEKENMWRLRKCLQGAAKQAVSALLVSAASPATIMSTLELQFGNPDIILSHILVDVKKLQPMSHEYYKEIVPFSIKIKNFVAAVDAMGRNEYLQGVQLVSIVLAKLPTVLISKWADYWESQGAVHRDTKMKALSDFLMNEASKISTACVSVLDVRPHANKPRQRSENVLLQGEVPTHTDKCRYCQLSKHMLPECPRFRRALRKDRWEYVKRNRICFKCLIARHSRATCPAAACDKNGCGLPHHRLLHCPRNNENVRGDEGLQSSCVDRAVEPPSPPEVVSHVNISKCKVLLKVVPVNIHGPNGNFTTTALLDDGSTVSLISANLAERVGLRGRRESMRVSGPWDGEQLECHAHVVKLNVSNMDGNMFSFNVRSVKELSLPEQDLSVINCQSYCHLNSIKEKLCCSLVKPEILIGQDNYELLLSQELIVGKPNEPCASLTALGWCVHGRVPKLSRLSLDHSTLCLASGPDREPAWDNVHEQIRHFFSIESMGVSAKPRENSEDLLALARLEQTATLIDGRWHVGLPWKDSNCKMPNSYPNALTRLRGVERKIQRNVEYGARYVERINHLFINDFAEKILNDRVSPRTWYLPHFGVDNPNKKKLRLVFDAAAQTNGLCLNDYFYKGPDLLMSLLGIMFRFRENRIALMGDIKDMFLRIKILAEDRDAFRFLWRDKPSEPVGEYQMTSLIFGANCSPFVAQFVKNKNAQRFSCTMPSAVAAIVTQHYMDDYIDSVSDEEIATQLVKDICHIYKQGGFEMRNWSSNSEKVLDGIPTEVLASTAIRFKVDKQNDSERTLGLLWFPKEDRLSFDLSFKCIPEELINGQRKPTKREMLRIIMSIFDVFGFLSPITINGKILLQDTWRLSLDWDDPISEDICERWRKWLQVLSRARDVRIPRHYKMAAAESVSDNDIPVTDVNMSGYTDLQLHVFCDASPKAMCAVAYWRWKNNDCVFVAFIASKCRVAPVKTISVPRLELQAALLAARLAATINCEHKIKPKNRYFWSDSTTVLHWVRNDARNYKSFVAHRLGEIDELTRVNEWRYVPTKLNVADFATRESYDDSILQREWLNGPKFLYCTEAGWPKDTLKPEVIMSNLEFVSTIQTSIERLPVPDCSRFSSWLRLQRTTVAVLTFINKCRKRSCENKVMLMEFAERLLIKQAQAESFGEELAAIKAGKNVGTKSKLLSLSPFLDEHGILRADGRIDAATSVEQSTKRPIILDGHHGLAKLIVRHYHVKAAHGNQETVVNELRQKYWLIRLRPTVKFVASRCMFCRIRKARPQIPRMGELPPARLAHHVRPFTYCGIDLFGPYEVTIGRRREKRYGVLFTCLTVRAIHIELVHSLSTDSLILALRRMASRRGWPSHIYSDNGTNLRGAEAELKKSIQRLDVKFLQNEAANNATTWTFIPPLSPHWGGAWERLIRSVKDTLRVILRERAPREETFNTLLAEVENMVNSRPLTHVSVELGSEEALTPNHFLLGQSSNLPVMGIFDESDFYLRRQWRISQRLADMFWKRWLKEVLPNLLPRRKWQAEHTALKVGDLVVIMDPDGPRNVWPRGVIQQLFPGKDGRVRMVKVKTKTGALVRSVARVATIPVVEE